MRSQADMAGRGVLPIAALALSCVEPGAPEGDEVVGDGDGDGEGDGDLACTEPGTPVGALEPLQPPEGIPLPTCSEGWGSDAPLREADWAIELADVDTFGAIVRSLPDERILVGTHQSLRWLDDEGHVAAETPFDGADLLDGQLVVHDDGRIHVVRTSDRIVIQELGEAGLVSEVEVDLEVSTTRVIGLYPLDGSDWLLVGSQYDMVEQQLEAFFAIVDALGSVQLRKARPLPSTYYGYGYASPQPLAFAAFDGERLLFGAVGQQWLVDVEDGSLVTPTLGVAGNLGVVATRDGFAAVGLRFGPLSMDGLVELLDPLGTSLVTQTYDRLGSADAFSHAASRPGGGVVVGGSEGVWWSTASGSGQPAVMAIDAQGNAEWKGRLAVSGYLFDLDVDAEGRVLAVGWQASEVGNEDGDGGVAGAFLARWSGG